MREAVVVVWGRDYECRLVAYLVAAGVDGVFMASLAVDYQIHATYWVVSHIHYVLFGGSVFGVFAAFFFWFPKIFGVRLNERLGKWCFALMFIGFNMTFIPMAFMGIEGMARRVYTYPDIGHLASLNAVASIGGAILALGVFVFFVDVIVSVRVRAPVPDNPWGGYSLEWATSSPPPEFNFHALPPIRGRRPLWDG